MSSIDLEREMLSRLGLPDQAGPEEIETAYGDVVAYLNAAPHDLRAWAKGQIAAADEAYAILSDPAVAVENATRVESPKKIVRTESRRARVERKQALEEPQPRARRIGPLGRAAVASVAVVAVLAAGYAVYASDRPSVPGLSGTPAPEATGALDSARVGALMQTITSDPNNTSALQELADIYFQAADYQTAADWENKVLALKPDDVTAHLAAGAASYNLGDSTTAETHWRRVLELDPKNVEAHYDLGFMYFSAEPPDVDKTIAEWQQVVELAPDSQIAQTVSAHLQTLESWKSSAPPSGAPGSPAPLTTSVPPTPSLAP